MLGKLWCSDFLPENLKGLLKLQGTARASKANLHEWGAAWAACVPAAVMLPVSGSGAGWLVAGAICGVCSWLVHAVVLSVYSMFAHVLPPSCVGGGGYGRLQVYARAPRWQCRRQANSTRHCGWHAELGLEASI